MTTVELDGWVLDYLADGEGDVTRILRDLRPTVREMYQRYCRYQEGARLDYDDPRVQAGYLLRYLPVHRITTRRQLDRLVRQGVAPRRVVSLGCGPGACVLGLAEVSRRHGLDCALTAIDRADWSRWLGCLADHVELPFVFEQIPQEMVPSEHPEVREADLVIVQNLIGEHFHDTEWMRPFALGLRAMKPEATLLILDRLDYGPQRLKRTMIARVLHTVDQAAPPIREDRLLHGVGDRDPRLRLLFTGEDGLIGPQHVKSYVGVARIASEVTAMAPAKGSV